MYSNNESCEIEYDTKSYIDFLNEKTKTENNKTYLEILSYSDEELDSDHAFIQWLFPTTTQSNYSKKCPIIDIEQLQIEIIKDVKIINKLIMSQEMMLEYWGLTDNQNIKKIEKLNGHDALRLSRMLQSLVYHGKKDLALTTYEIISQHINDKNSLLNPLIYVGTELKNMVPFEYLHNITLEDKMTFSQKVIFMDVWKYHLLKAINEYDEKRVSK